MCGVGFSAMLPIYATSLISNTPLVDIATFKDCKFKNFIVTKHGRKMRY